MKVANGCEAFENNLSVNKKFSKTQLSKIIQSDGFLGKLLEPFLKTVIPLMKNVLKSFAKSTLISLGLTKAASVADAGFQKKKSLVQDVLWTLHNNLMILESLTQELQH